MSDKLKIPQATAKGYIEVEDGGVFDFSYPESKTRRGRVQEGGADLTHHHLPKQDTKS